MRQYGFPDASAGVEAFPSPRPPAPVSECRAGTGVPDIHNIDAIKAQETCGHSAGPRGRGATSS